MVDPFNASSGAIGSPPGAGWPPAEGMPSTFQLLDVSASCAWSGAALSQRAMWSTGTILCWPQVRDEFPKNAASRRFPGVMCQGEIIAEAFKDPNNVRLWNAALDILVSTGKGAEMRSIFWPFAPNLREELLARNLAFRFELAPAPKYVEIRIAFSHRTGTPAAGFPRFNVRADLRPLISADIPPGVRMV